MYFASYRERAVTMSGPTVDEPGLAAEPGWISVVESGDGKFTEHLLDGRHRLIADEPVAAGGKDRGPGPYELLLMALGACTTMTLRLYADRKRWPLERVSVRLRHAKIYAQDCADCETKQGRLDRTGAASASPGDRRYVPGAPHAHLGDQ